MRGSSKYRGFWLDGRNRRQDKLERLAIRDFADCTHAPELSCDFRDRKQVAALMNRVEEADAQIQLRATTTPRAATS